MYSIDLSPQQEEAVWCTHGPILVSAGAGSGKTRTLSAKVAYLVKHLGYSPSRILAITFTNKAAEEMKARLEAVTGYPREAFPWVRTFHSACFRILKNECELLGYRLPISVYSESQQLTHLKKIALKLNVDKKYVRSIHYIISKAKNTGDPEQYLSRHKGIPKILDLYKLYNETLKENNAVDFDDILLLVRNMFVKHPEVRKRYQQFFDYILIDEFQDSNALQNEIAELILRDGNLMVVGDDYQSIYQFRGAEPRFFVDFPNRFPNAKVFKLEQNYRSTKPIVAAADALIAHNTFRIEKKCFSVKDGPPVKICKFFDEKDEASWIADECKKYHYHDGIPWNQIAVLYRTRFCSLAFEEAMRERKVPYKIVGARGFYESKEVQDINAYLISSVNPKDDIAFERVINTPRRGIGNAMLKKINAFRMPGMSLQEACWAAVQANALSKKATTALITLKNHLDAIACLPPNQAINMVLNDVGYGKYLEEYAENSEDYINRMGNVELLLHLASSKKNIEEYLEDSALIREDQDTDEGTNEGVRLMTFHAAKGLEFLVVFVIGLEEGLLPHWRAILDEDGFTERIEGVEEERRLLYVAMTRAIKHLHLSQVYLRQGKIAEPSRFLDEIPEEHTQVNSFLDKIIKRRPVR